MPRPFLKVRPRRAPLPAAARVFLETGDDAAAQAAALEADALFDLFLARRGQVALWQEHGTAITAEWVARQPGTRPWGWWRFEAPEPRRRLGGTGTPKHEVLAFVPVYRCGIPMYWLDSSIDPGDPPRYESQAAYLARLGLLAPGERRRLGAAAFEPEAILPPAAEDGSVPPDHNEEER